MMKTLMATAYELLLDTVFNIMAIAVIEMCIRDRCTAIGEEVVNDKNMVIGV